MTDAEKVALYETFLKKLAEKCEGKEPESPVDEDEGTFGFCGNTDDAYEAGLQYGEEREAYDLAVSAHNLLCESGVLQALDDNEETDC